jgi:hypothetical protein
MRRKRARWFEYPETDFEKTLFAGVFFYTFLNHGKGFFSKRKRGIVSIFSGENKKNRHHKEIGQAVRRAPDLNKNDQSIK